MKIRQGHVSNSSSSSFIIGVGLIKDINKVRDFVETCTEKYNCPMILTTSQIRKEKPWSVELRNGNVEVESFMGNSVAVPFDERKEQFYLVYEYNGDEGDGYFINNEEDWDIDYDIDFDFFSAEESKIAAIFDNKELVDGDWTYGAGRNG